MPKLSPDARRHKAEYTEAWRREHTRQVKIRLNVHKDADVLQRLDAVPNMTAYISALVRADIAADPTGPDFEESEAPDAEPETAFITPDWAP